MSFTIQQPKKKYIKPGLALVFIDRISFLNNSRDNLVKNLGEIDFYHLSQEVNAIILDLIKKKSIFPYHYCDNFEKFKEGLPSKCKFYNALTNCEINDKNYEDVLNVRKAFKMNTMNDYHDWYLKVGILLLACVFETKRKESISSFE